MFPATHTRWVTFDCNGTLVRSTRKEDGSPIVRPWDDVEPLLAELRARGYRLGVLTNYDEAQFETAHRTFRQPFDLFVTADRIRGLKPDLWHFRAFQRLAHVAKDRWVHVSSDLEHDILPAESFGIQRVWLDRDGTGTGPSHATAHVHSTAEVVKAVDWMFQECAAYAS